MFILDWFKSVLNYLGLAQKKGKILFLGLDNAGKTTLLHVLKDNRIAAHQPTNHPHSEDLIIDSITFKTFDLGGHEAARLLWKDYFSTIDGIIYLVDSSDRTRFDESSIELQKLLETPELQNVPVVVLGNKIDIGNAASEEELRNAFKLPSHLTYQGPAGNRDNRGGRPIQVFMCSVLNRMGYREAFQWLAKFLPS